MDFNLLYMGQNERFVFDTNDFDAFDIETGNQALNYSMENLSTFFVIKNSMGDNHSHSTARHSEPARHFLTFFNRLGNYNVYHLLPNRKKMAAIVIKLSVILANCFGIYLFFYWLFIDFAGIKVFLTSVGVLAYGGMKLYEKYLDLKKKKRQDEAEEQKHKSLFGKK